MTDTKNPPKDQTPDKQATSEQMVEMLKLLGLKSSNIEQLMLSSGMTGQSDLLMALSAMHSMLHMDEVRENLKEVSQDLFTEEKSDENDSD